MSCGRISLYKLYLPVWQPGNRDRRHLEFLLARSREADGEAPIHHGPDGTNRESVLHGGKTFYGALAAAGASLRPKGLSGAPDGSRGS